MAPRKSEVWKYFEKDNKHVICSLCQKKLIFSNNTSNLFQHIRLKHSSVFKDLNSISLPCADENTSRQPHSHVISPSISATKKTTSLKTSRPVSNQMPLNAISPSKSPTKKTTSLKTSRPALNEVNCSDELPTTSKQCNVKDAFENIKSYNEGGSKQIKTTKALVEMLILDHMPFIFVEKRGFLNLMKTLCPLYKVPSAMTIKRHVDQLYETDVNRFKDFIKIVPILSLTSDIWTDVQMRSMLGITVHGIREKKQFSLTVGVFELCESHTAKYISEKMLEALQYFDIQTSNIAVVVTDNGANIKKAAIDTFGPQKYVPCFAHTLNLICEASLGIVEVKILIGKCRSIITWFKKHGSATDSLRKLQALGGIPEGQMLKLILDVKTRWNSTFYMLERFVKLVPYISQILMNYRDAPLMTSSKEKEDVMEIISVLRPMESLTKQISGGNYSTLSQIIPLVRCCREQLKKVVCKYDTSKRLKAKMLSEYNRRFESIESEFIYAASTILDPRFKNIHFTDSMAMSLTLKSLRDEMASLNESIGSISESSSSLIEEFDLWETHKSLIHSKKKRKIDSDLVQDELSFYLNAPVIGLKESPFDAWEDMKNIYPQLYMLSKKYCYLIGTSVPAERLFSEAGATVNEARNRLLTSRLSKLLFLNSWLKFQKTMQN